MAYIVYNNGYQSILCIDGKTTGKRYFFKKRFVTKVNEKDVDQILSTTPKDIPWCSGVPKYEKVFLRLEEYVEYIKKRGKIFSKEQYLKDFLITE